MMSFNELKGIKLNRLGKLSVTAPVYGDLQPTGVSKVSSLISYSGVSLFVLEEQTKRN